MCSQLTFWNVPGGLAQQWSHTDPNGTTRSRDLGSAPVVFFQTRALRVPAAVAFQRQLRVRHTLTDRPHNSSSLNGSTETARLTS